MNTLTVTLTDTRLIDGWVAAANSNGYAPEELALEFLQQQGKSYADLNKIGIITSAAFISRFTPAEYGAILAAAEPDPDAAEDAAAISSQVQQLLNELFNEPTVTLDDPRLMPGLQLLVSAGLLDAERPAEILSYDRPEPVRTVIEGVDYIRARDEEGRFVADDPATPDVNEAWVEVPS